MQPAREDTAWARSSRASDGRRILCGFPAQEQRLPRGSPVDVDAQTDGTVCLSDGERDIKVSAVLPPLCLL